MDDLFHAVSDTFVLREGDRKSIMNIGKTLYVSSRKAWRSWLAKNHKSAPEIWLIYYKKGSGKKRIPYNDAVEEAICYGWIDGIVKAIDGKKYTQRFTPRRPRSQWSPANTERLVRLIRKKKVTRAGLRAAATVLEDRKTGVTSRPAFVPSDILGQLKGDPDTWKHFQLFPASYKRIRIGWIDSARKRPDVFRRRLRYFLKMTRRNKKFGMVR